MSHESTRSSLVFVGSYGSRDEEGIRVYHLDRAAGALHPVSSVVGLENPSFLAFHPTLPILYAVNEVSRMDGRPGGGVTALSYDPGNGTMRVLSRRSSGGAGPAYVSVDRDGKSALVANYGTGSVSMLPIDSEGRLEDPSDTIQHEGSGPDRNRQEGPHAHCILPDPTNRYAFAVDLGIDSIARYRMDWEKGRLIPDGKVAVEPGSGPRHIAFHPKGSHAVAITELGNSMISFRYDGESGALEPITTVSTLPVGFTNVNHPAEVLFHPSGRWVVGSNRGHDSLVVASFDDETGALAVRDHVSVEGENPRSFTIDPAGEFCIAANQDTNDVVVLRVEAASGRITPTGHRVSARKPVCVRMPAG